MHVKKTLVVWDFASRLASGEDIWAPAFVVLVLCALQWYPKTKLLISISFPRSPKCKLEGRAEVLSH
jgi:hypothetical protein